MARLLASARLLTLLALLALALGAAHPAAAQIADVDIYQNPLPVTADGAAVESCADPSVIRGAAPDSGWYMYCTTDPLRGDDRDEAGNLVFRLVPMFRSDDLVNWTYEGDAFAERPAYAAPNAGLWAPEIDYFDGTYYLFYGVTDVQDTFTAERGACPWDNAIGFATADSPLGPWTHSAAPLIDPRPAGPAGPSDPCNQRYFWTFDPEVIQAEDGASYIYYGSYFGGVQVRPLNLDTMATDPAEAVQVTIANRYEGPEVVYRGGYYYLFVSATDCCRGPLTGYSVFAGRSQSPTGPFVDREGVPLTAGRVGGTPVLSMNGNRWVGPGHNTIFQDAEGGWWTAYHAIDREDPYFAGTLNFTKRPVLLDPLDWIRGWPTVRAGSWISDKPQPAPAAQPGDESDYRPDPRRDDAPGQLLGAYSDSFSDGDLEGWEWVRPPDSGFSVNSRSLSFATQAADLFEGNNSASVLTAPLPEGDYLVETKVRLDLPAEGCCYNYVQAGLVIYGDDDNYVKLVHVSIWETRQTEFAKEQFPVPDGYPRYGNTVVGRPGTWTYLRIARRLQGDEELYTAYTSRDRINWVRGGAWTHQLGPEARVGLVSMGGTGFTAVFDYVRVYSLER